jgi:asparaginyl-tRNA synthetase
MVTRRIVEILKHGQSDESVTIQGWVRTKRELKGFAFVEVNDGSSLTGLQAVLDANLPDYEDLLKQLATGAAVAIIGKLVESPGKGQNIEMKAESPSVVQPILKPILDKKNATLLNFYVLLVTCDRVLIL